MQHQTVIQRYGLPPPLPQYERVRPKGVPGANGAVFEELCVAGPCAGLRVAAKYVHRRDLFTAELRTRLARELRNHVELVHPHVASFRRVLLLGDSGWVCILSELCDAHPYSNLREWVEANRQTPEPVARGIMAQLLSAMQHLHDQAEVVHRDLKLDNVCLAASSVAGVVPYVKVVDFGHSKNLDTDTPPHTTNIGTAIYSAPEILERNRLATLNQLPLPDEYDAKKVDVWMLGMTLLIMLSAQYPSNQAGRRLTRASEQNTALAAQLGQLHLSSECVAFVRRCLTLDPTSRPTMADLAADAWMTAGGVSPPALSAGAVQSTAEQTMEEVELVINILMQPLP